MSVALETWSGAGMCFYNHFPPCKIPVYFGSVNYWDDMIHLMLISIRTPGDGHDWVSSFKDSYDHVQVFDDLLTLQ